MLTIDTSDFTRAAAKLDRAIQQLPFAFSRALNDAARETRSGLIGNTWPTHVKVRKPAFLGWALRTEFATKQKLWVEINDERAQGRGHLGLHDTGGVKVARGRLAIPGPTIRRGGNGVVTSQKPRNLKRTFVKGDVIYQSYGPKGKPYVRTKTTTTKSGRVRAAGTVKGGARAGAKRGRHVMYTLKSSAMIKADVPFHQDFERIFKASFMSAAPKRISEAFASMR